MKKILLLLLILPTIVLADSAKVINILPRCIYVSDNSITIPVEVISQNDGTIDNLLPKYLLGSIDTDNLEINIASNNPSYNIEMESSDIYFSLKNNKKNKEYKALDKVFDFEINIVFKETIPKSLNVLGNTIILSKDKKTCQKINNYNSKDVTCKSFYLNDNNYPYIMIIGLLIIIIIVLWKRSGNNAIHKIKNK